jgi:hypothetical protein
MMDSELKVILSGTIDTLKNIPAKDRTWGRILEAMQRNSLLETTQNDETTRLRSLTKERSHTFKFDGSPDPAIVREVDNSAPSVPRVEPNLRLGT